jgi:anti-anti-sigma regulatory factor
MAGVRIPRFWGAPRVLRATTTSRAIPIPAGFQALSCFARMRPCFCQCRAVLFHERVLDVVATSPTPVRWLVVAAEPITSVDVTAADMLAELDETLHRAGVELCFAEMKDPVKDKLKRFGLFARLGQEVFFPTIETAVSSYLETHSVDWVDSEDRGR